MLATVSASSLSLTTYDRKGQAIAPTRSLSANPESRPDQSTEAAGLTGEDAVVISAEGRQMARQGTSTETPPANGDDTPPKDTGLPKKSQQADPALTAAEEQMVQKLKARDTEVRAHEMAHLASAGSYARGGPTYTYQQGPDGQGYAVGGEVPIDIGKEATPEATIAKMETVKRAALAPADPSGADQQIAAAATALEMQARQELQHTAGGRNKGQTKDTQASTMPAKSPAASPTTATGSRRLAMDLFA